MKRFATAALALAAMASAASAGTVDFTFTGSAFGTYAASGSGSFTYTGSGAIGLSDITAFTFTTSRDNSSTGFVSTYTYGLSDLTGFAGSIDGSGNVLSLDLVTMMKNVSSANGAAPQFGFRTSGASFGALFSELGPGESIDDAAGTVTYTTVPAPGAIGALAGAGMMAARRRRR